MIDFITSILPEVGVGGIIGAIIAWYFGGKQQNSKEVDNDSHQREKEYFEMVDARAEKETKQVIERITKCAETCAHSLNCPVLNQWKENGINSK